MESQADTLTVGTTGTTGEINLQHYKQAKPQATQEAAKEIHFLEAPKNIKICSFQSQ